MALLTKQTQPGPDIVHHAAPPEDYPRAELALCWYPHISPLPAASTTSGFTCRYGGNEMCKQFPRCPLYRLWYFLSVQVLLPTELGLSGLFTICNAITCSVAVWNYSLVGSAQPGES